MYRQILLGGASVVLAACGGGGGGGFSGAVDETEVDTVFYSTPTEKVFLDSPVEGLGYETFSQSGETDADGAYTSKFGEMVRFYIKGPGEGDPELELGTTIDSGGVVTPLSFDDGENPDTHLNMLRFLQTLDDDGNPDNGIKIDKTKLQAGYETIVFELSVDVFETTYEGAYSLADLKEVIDHFGVSLASEDFRKDGKLIDLKDTVWEWTGKYPLGDACTNEETGQVEAKYSTGTVTWGRENGVFKRDAGDWENCEDPRPGGTSEVEFTATNDGVFFDCGVDGVCTKEHLNSAVYLTTGNPNNDCRNESGSKIDCVISKSFNPHKNILTITTNYLNGNYVYDQFKLISKLDLRDTVWFMESTWDQCGNEDRAVISFGPTYITTKPVSLGTEGSKVLLETNQDCTREEVDETQQTYSQVADDREFWPCDPKDCRIDEMTRTVNPTGVPLAYIYRLWGIHVEEGTLTRRRVEYLGDDPETGEALYGTQRIMYTRLQ